MAIDLTGIQNVGEFYSHHYLDALLEKDLKGLFTQWKREEEDTPDKRLNRLATPFFRAKSDALSQGDPKRRYQPSHHIHVELLQALGYEYDFDVQYLREGEAVPVLAAVKRNGHHYLWLVETTFVDPDEGISPLDQPILRVQYPQSTNGHQPSSLTLPPSPWESTVGEIFRRDEPPRWLILFAGRYIYLLDRTKWGQGQYLLFDLDEIFGRRQLDTLRATAALLSHDTLCPDEGVPVHDTLDENSHKHAYAVSSDLKYGVRKAVELVANEYVWYQRNIGKQALFQDDDLAKKLTREALTYLYRLLFLFYAEARGGELGIMPMKSEAYRTGYSLESLRDLEQVPLNTPQAQDGYYIHESLNGLFRLVNEGYQPQERQLELDFAEGETPEYDDYGFTMGGLHSPLFSRESTPLLSSAKFRNLVLQEVLQLLSLSKEGRGRNSDRGRISYTQLGINQLGAVYEGLLSYTGFFAQEDLFEVKPAKHTIGKEDPQTYFIPESDAEKYKQDEFVYEADDTGRKVRKRYLRGSFIFHLAGRDREKSASYYTPEVLTQCVVKYSLKELLGENPDDENWRTADEILVLTICEPAMGSGAFINEALNQLSDAYLQRKQAELGQDIPPDDYREERQKVKAYLALNNVYGVDLNPMAVELAEVSLWLNIIHEGMPAPWFGARLAVGNSLIGARREVYTAEDVLSGAYKKKAPTPAPLGQPRPEGSVYHWLLPDEGMAAFDKDKVIKERAPEADEAIKQWRKEFTKRITKDELKLMQQLSDAADSLWEKHTQEREELLQNTSTPILVWGQEQSNGGRGTKVEEKDSSFIVHDLSFQELSVAQKNAAHSQLGRPTGIYRRLKLAMDYWCALWFWPIQDALALPIRSEFLGDLATILIESTIKPEERTRQPDLPTFIAETEESPKPSERMNFDELGQTHPRFSITMSASRQNRFHHWELAFSEVTAIGMGFDLILGNPPWIKLAWSEKTILSDYEPVLAIRKVSSSNTVLERDRLLDNPKIRNEYLIEFANMVGALSFLGSMQNYPLLKGIQTNLYKCFVTRSWQLAPDFAAIGLLHPEGVFDDSKGGLLRAHFYPRLMSHFQFRNELKLFSEIGNTRTYGVNVYSHRRKDLVDFDNISYLFHPSTVDNCFKHDGLGLVPAIKTQGNAWELRGHRRRILRIDRERLKLFAGLFDEPGTPSMQARLPFVHSIETLELLVRLAEQETTLGEFREDFFETQGWNETGAQKDGTIRRNTVFPETIDEWILSGAHIFVANPLYQTPNEGCRSHRDYSKVDLTQVGDDYLPRTNYVRACSLSDFLSRVPKWKDGLTTEYYRQVFRAMLGQNSERVLIGAIAPRHITHINGIRSYIFKDRKLLVLFSGLCSSIVYDFLIRSTGKQNLHELPNMLPVPKMSSALSRLINARTLRLNCLTEHYIDLWKTSFEQEFADDIWAKEDSRLDEWTLLSSRWSRMVALRTPFARRQALLEIDVLTSRSLGLTLDQLITIFRVNSPVMRKYDLDALYDQRGMEVPVKTVHGALAPDEGHPQYDSMVPPFTAVDREADYREAWEHFTRRLKEEG